MTKNLISALEHAGLKPIKVDLSSNKRFMKKYEEYMRELKKFILGKEQFKERSRRDIIFGVGYGWRH